MSMLLAVVTTAQAVVASPTPSPSPQVVQVTHEVVRTVQVASPELIKYAELALLVVGGLGASILHQVFESLSKRKDGWSRGFNLSLQVLLGLTVAALSAFINGQLILTWDSAINFAAMFLIVLGTSQGRYAFKKWVDSLGTDSATPDPVAALGVPDAIIPTKASV